MARRTIGCAIWSLGIPDTVRALHAAREIGFGAVQFTFFKASDLAPANLEAIRDALKATALAVPAGMISFRGEDYSTIEAIRASGGFAPAATFTERLEHCRRVGEGLARLGIRHVTTHAGFIPEAGDPAYADVLDRVAKASDVLHEAGLSVGLETGQETSGVLLRMLDDLGRGFLKVNYDPANLILYGVQEPVEAARVLGSRVGLMHAKDARWSARPGREWGKEVPLGQGDVDFRAVLAALGEGGFVGPIVVERESGSDRAGDMVAGRKFLESIMQANP